MPRGGLGNLIALPLQFAPRKAGNSVFIDADFKPYPDQWRFLSTIQRMAADPPDLAPFSEAEETPDRRAATKGCSDRSRESCLRGKEGSASSHAEPAPR